MGLPAASLLSVGIWARLAREPVESALHIFPVDFSKIFILNDLLAPDRFGSAQNLEPQGLTCKIFQNKDLAWVVTPYFLVGITKVLISNGLGSLDGKRSWQNPEPQGLTGKIFWNKDLALGRKPLGESTGKNWLGEPSRMERAWAFWNSQSRSSVTGSAIFIVEGCGIPVSGLLCGVLPVCPELVPELVPANGCLAKLLLLWPPSTIAGCCLTQPQHLRFETPIF
jgi:hypothetical protein